MWNNKDTYSYITINFILHVEYYQNEFNEFLFYNINQSLVRLNNTGRDSESIVGKTL